VFLTEREITENTNERVTEREMVMTRMMVNNNTTIRRDEEEREREERKRICAIVIWSMRFLFVSYFFIALSLSLPLFLSFYMLRASYSYFFLSA
jgi:hypothetical protein